MFVSSALQRQMLKEQIKYLLDDAELYSSRRPVSKAWEACILS